MAQTPIMYGRGDNSPSVESSPMSTGNNDSFACLEKMRRETAGQSQFSNDMRTKSTSIQTPLMS